LILTIREAGRIIAEHLELDGHNALIAVLDKEDLAHAVERLEAAMDSGW
jgi:hypothetical protein